jgi:hypothetical protein
MTFATSNKQKKEEKRMSSIDRLVNTKEMTMKKSYVMRR